jgi:protein ImuB
MIPSYDDLERAIPDVEPADLFAAAASVVMRTHRPPDAAASIPRAGELTVPRFPDPGSGRLFAALHAPTAPVDALVAIAREFSPRIERHAGNTVVFDASGLGRLFETPDVLAAHVLRAGAPHVAVARSQIAAVLLARARAGITVAIGEPGGALRDVPLQVLRQLLTDLDANTATPTVRAAAVRAARERRFEVLARWGLMTVGELAALPAPDLSARLGRDVVAVQRLARGIDPRPLVPDPETIRFLASFELEWPVDTLEPLSFVFARLLEPLAAALEKADRGAVAVHLALRLTDRSTVERTLPLPIAMRDPRVLRTLLMLDLEARPPSAAVDAVRLELDPAPARIVQFSLLERAVPSPETIATLMARLGALVGDARCGSPALLDTHRPDGFEMRPVAFDERLGQRGMSPEPRTAHNEPRPPMAPPCVLRRFRPPVAVRVTIAHGRPAHLAIDRKGMPGGVVRQSAGPWRTSGGWWDGTRWNRDEWDVAFEDGSVCRLFCDRDGGHWFVEGLVD